MSEKSESSPPLRRQSVCAGNRRPELRRRSEQRAGEEERILWSCTSRLRSPLPVPRDCRVEAAYKDTKPARATRPRLTCEGRFREPVPAGRARGIRHGASGGQKEQRHGNRPYCMDEETRTNLSGVMGLEDCPTAGCDNCDGRRGGGATTAPWHHLDLGRRQEHTRTQNTPSIHRSA